MATTLAPLASRLLIGGWLGQWLLTGGIALVAPIPVRPLVIERRYCNESQQNALLARYRALVWRDRLGIERFRTVILYSVFGRQQATGCLPPAPWASLSRRGMGTARRQRRCWTITPRPWCCAASRSLDHHLPMGQNTSTLRRMAQSRHLGAKGRQHIIRSEWLAVLANRKQVVSWRRAYTLIEECRLPYKAATPLRGLCVIIGDQISCRLVQVLQICWIPT